MWIFSKYGFYSVASARDIKGNIDPDLVMIRSRMREHLVQLKVRFPQIALNPIECSQNNDYMFRLFMPKKQWAELLSEMALEQTWGNFKDEASKFEKLFQLSYSYVDALHEVWEIMHRVQKRENRLAFTIGGPDVPNKVKKAKWLKNKLEAMHKKGVVDGNVDKK